MKAIILNDYPDTPYATWVYEGKKKIETRMGRLFTFRGDIAICCGKGNSVGPYAGLAMCIVQIYAGGNMLRQDVDEAMISWHPARCSLYLRNWRYFSTMFPFNTQYVSGPYQGIFDISIPPDVTIIPQPQITGSYYKENSILDGLF